ncbi:YraN family protein [Hydrogenimonas sp.]
MSRSKGDIAEEKAAEWLRSQGCRIIGRNVYSRFGEIDIVASREGVLHFVEVKSGQTFEPVYNITPTKLSRLLRTIESYLKKEGFDMPWQVDAFIVKGDSFEWIENITM